MYELDFSSSLMSLKNLDIKLNKLILLWNKDICFLSEKNSICNIKDQNLKHPYQSSSCIFAYRSILPTIPKKGKGGVAIYIEKILCKTH